jgi:hypothetical protein
MFQNTPSNLLVVRDISERGLNERELAKASQLESICPSPNAKRPSNTTGQQPSKKYRFSAKAGFWSWMMKP